MKPARHRQSGIALIALLILLIMAGSYAFYRSANIASGRIQHDAKLAITLAQAKEALIAAAVIDDKRPGRMLCPDIVGGGNSDWSLSRTSCDASSGWLPWKTLGLTEGSDDHGTQLRYAFTPVFGGTVGTPLNSDTLGSLVADNNEVVAIVIATRGPLDPRNSDGDAKYYSGTSNDSDNNDVIATVTRQELMAAVEKRIAGEVLGCLEQQADPAVNPQQVYPWPAPLSNSIFKGKIDSRFGMIPDTQPGGSAKDLVDKALTEISKYGDALINPPQGSGADQQLASALSLQASAAYARLVFDRIAIVATALNQAAIISTASAKDLETYAENPGTVPAGNVTQAGQDLLLLTESLADSGFDLMALELLKQNVILEVNIKTARETPDKAAFRTIQTQANSRFEDELYFLSYSPNQDINDAIVGARDAATAAKKSAEEARKNISNPDAVTEALDSADNLYKRNQQLLQVTLDSRATVGSNVALETLRTDASVLASTKPKKADLKDVAKDIQFWAQLANSYSASIATKSAKSINAKDYGDDSAYTSTRQLLGTLDGEKGTIAMLESYIKDPKDTKGLSEALIKTSKELLGAKQEIKDLQSTLESSIGDAVMPTVWLSRPVNDRCNALKPPTGDGNWWTNNDWKKYLFYQISDRVRPTTGSLRVNGNGTYRVVVLSSGKAIGLQPKARKKVGDFLEGINSDASRDGDALNPSVAFASASVSATFNDRLAY